MAVIGSIISQLNRVFTRLPATINIQPVRHHNIPHNYNPNKYVDARMLRDAKRRKLAKDYAELRVRIMAMKRNDILPIELRDLAEKHMQDHIPRTTSSMQHTGRCVMTSRPRGNLRRFRLSRFMFRNMVDYNGRLAGIQRAMW